MISSMTTSSIKHSGGYVLAWTCLAVSGSGSLVFINDVADDRSNGMDSEACSFMFSTQILQN